MSNLEKFADWLQKEITNAVVSTPSITVTIRKETLFEVLGKLLELGVIQWTPGVIQKSIGDDEEI